MSNVSDNYGARWVKQVFNWMRLKTLEGYERDMLIRDAVIDCGLRKNKTIELINEWVELGFMKEQKDFIYWGDTAPITQEMKPYLEAKEKLKENIINNKNDELIKTQRDKYSYYVENCKKDNEEPLSYDEWLDKNKGEI